MEENEIKSENLSLTPDNSAENVMTYIDNYLKDTFKYLAGMQNAFDSYFKQIYPELNKEGKQERCNQGK